MTAPTTMPTIPGPRQAEPPRQLEEERSAQAIYEEVMGHFAAMYEEWSQEVRAIRDA